MDRASLDFVLDHLAAHGVGRAVLSSPYLEATFRPFIDRRTGPPSITWITETEPLGTGGAIVHALEQAGANGTFVALNGDILTDLDLTAMLAFHRDRAAAVTIALHHVEDARAFGLVPTEPDGRVREFREKPETATPGDVNAGTYVIEPSALEGWTSGAALSIEREIFPSVIASGRPVFGFASDAYWLDLGTPEKYLQAHFDLFEGKVHAMSYAAPWVAPSASVDLLAHLGRWVAVGAGVRIGPRAQIDDSVLHPGAVVDEGAEVVRSIVGPGARVGRGASLADTVLGEGSTVPAGQRLEGARVPSFAEARPPD
jgi:mannose-1-phosphate guanylyltransferase